MKTLFRKYFELCLWVVALILLASMDPNDTTHYSFCIFKFLGIKFCPGCGLGHSISYLFHGNIRASIAAHPLGPFAVGVILWRIFNLSKLHLYFYLQNKHYGQQF